ncbi:GumC domain-containing protein [Bdellovibrio svalbardensis]|uniref:Polysaccharide chain length determinant N-terminal domain-containing protein n=1 Tax=Bdellovibrio svalbardensis TaxID=2972972 RepID=A0ABT6DF68_9BACT|nr:hypothetical protein [Bdellovibrio svalbardensis]MDG0815482.1 hypothetical protein [Bdellovibrio svalbardensis]
MADQHIEPELTVGEIIKLYLSHWRMFAVFTVVLFAVSAVVYVVKIPYVATTSMVFNDTQNSSLQAFSSQFFGLSKSLQDSKKGSSVLSKHIEYLKTREFFEALLVKINERGNSAKITLEERQGYEQLKADYLNKITDKPESKLEVLQKLDKWIKATLDSDFEIKLTAATPSRALSLFLANTVTELAGDLLKKRESEEITRVEEFITTQKRIADEKLNELGHQLAEVQNKDESILPLASKDKMGEYVSDLLVRANEIKLKMAENKKLIEYLGKDRSSQKESTLYGVGGKIETLKFENNLLAGKLSQVQGSIDRLKQEVKELPYQAQMAEDLKKKSDMEFNRYKELNAALGKVEAAKLSIGTRFEILDSARWETTLPQIGLLALALLSILLSQFFGSLIIYFRYLWNPDVVTAQASRNLLIFDNHSVDPRVIIENSKIKFSMKKQDSTSEHENHKDDEKKEIAWNLLNVGQSSDRTQ